MTIGDKIQLYRKELGMSQEELGQKLFVSRQTVSLWENGQTQPTIDNLVRLKEIFGVSVDEILNTEDTVQENPPAPKESYAFNFSDDELSEIIKIQEYTLIKRIILFTLFFITLLILSILNSETDMTTGFAAAMLVICTFVNIKSLITYKVQWNAPKEIMVKNTYEYKIYGDYLTLNIIRNNETVRTSKFYPSDIEHIQDIGKYFLIQVSGQIFTIRKSDLVSNSFFYTYQRSYTEKTTKKKPTGKYKNISSVLFIGSLLSILAALILEGIASGINYRVNENMWVFFLLTPIPIASVIFGFILKSKGFKYKKNVIAGIIMTILLCTYGSFSFIFSDTFDYSDEPILRAEQFIGIDIPASDQIVTTDMSKGEQSDQREYTYYTSNIHFDAEATEVFEKEIANDDKWISSVPNNLMGITSYLITIKNYDYILIYNIDTDEFNTIPSESGTYRFINIAYQTQTDDMIIIEYSMDYIK